MGIALVFGYTNRHLFLKFKNIKSELVFKPFGIGLSSSTRNEFATLF